MESGDIFRRQKIRLVFSSLELGVAAWGASTLSAHLPYSQMKSWQDNIVVLYRPDDSVSVHYHLSL